MYHVLYQITNLLDGMFYIGVHSTDNLKDDYMGSGKRIRLAIKKYGIENFKKTILINFTTREESLLTERLIVNKDFIAREDTYNIVIGGQCPPSSKGKTRGKPSQKHLDNLSASLKGKTSWKRGKTLEDIYDTKEEAEIVRTKMAVGASRPHPNKGKKYEDYMDEERANNTRKKIQNAAPGKWHTAKIRYINTGEILTMVELSEKYGFNKRTIRYILRGDRKADQHGNKFEVYEEKVNEN